MQQQLARYKLGIATLIGFTLIIFIAMLLQSSAAKQDNVTYHKALKIAEKLNDYTDNHYSIPISLNAAGITDAPDTISYKRLSSKSYEFCATYKSASNGVDATSIGAKLFTGGAYDPSDDNYQPDDYLYLTDHHKKGDNCQTIKPYQYSYDDYDNSTDSTTTDNSLLQ